jgi:MFS family permease
MRLRFAGLWRHPDFLKLWAGQTVSQSGSQITFLALPLTVILVLDASPVQMGILVAVGALPPLFVGLLAGAWIDRSRRRPILIAADWGRAALIIIVPIAALLDVLRIEYLYFVAFGLGTFDLFFNVAYRSFFPSLVKREQIVEGNSKLEVSRSAAEIAGPGLGGFLVQLVTAPFALLVDAFTFVVSAVFLGLIRAPEPEPDTSEKRQPLWKEAVEGVSVVVRNPVLRSLARFAGTGALFNAMFEAVAVLYMTHQLDISPALIGLIFSSGSVGLLAGALGGERVIRRFGLGQAIIGGTAMLAISDLALPLASVSLMTLVALLVMGSSSLASALQSIT